jgi:hypothetical protein
MPKTISGLFDDYLEGESVLRDLVENGFAREDISLVANNPSGAVVTIRADESMADRAVAIMERHRVVDIRHNAAP